MAFFIDVIDASGKSERISSLRTLSLLEGPSLVTFRLMMHIFPVAMWNSGRTRLGIALAEI